jgi:hypothetical protein
VTLPRGKHSEQEFQLRLEIAEPNAMGRHGHLAKSITSDGLHPTECPVCSGDSLKKTQCFTAEQAAELLCRFAGTSGGTQTSRET